PPVSISSSLSAWCRPVHLAFRLVRDRAAATMASQPGQEIRMLQPLCLHGCRSARRRRLSAAGADASTATRGCVFGRCRGTTSFGSLPPLFGRSRSACPYSSSMDRPLIQRRPETEDMTSDGLASAVFSASTTRWGARALLASALAFTAAPAWAQDGGPHWYGVDNGDQARLVYGVPDSDDTSLTFICDKGSAVVS